MTERDFCYWLQDYFELLPRNTNATLDDHQAHIVYKHLDLVKATGPSEFCEWLRTALDIGCHLEAKDGRTRTTEMIRERLARHFEHVIDKQYLKPEALNQIHNPSGKPSDVVARC